MAEKRKGEQRKRSSVDWQAIEHEYVTGGDNVSQRYLAGAHQVSLTSVQKACSRDGWVQKREEYREKRGAIALERTADQQAESLAQRNEDLGEEYYQAAIESVRDARATNEPRDRQAFMVSAGVATDKWRLVTGQNTAKSEQIIRGPYDDLTDDEATTLLEETVEVIRYSRQTTSNSATAT